MAQALFNLADQKDQALQEMIGLAIGAYGFAFHLRYMNRPPLPLLLNIPLMPFSLAETLLRTLVLSGTSSEKNLTGNGGGSASK